MIRLLLIPAVIAALGYVLFLIRRGTTVTSRAVLSEMQAILGALLAKRQEGAFAVFRFAGAGEMPDERSTADLQFSIEGGRLGLDWPLLAHRNIADQMAIADFMRARGHTVQAREMNKVRYLRVEDGDLPRLGLEIATGFYGLAPGTAVELIADGFAWPPR